MPASLQKIIALIIGAGLAGCAGSAVTRFYVLEATPAQVAFDPNLKKKWFVELGPLSVPALVDRKQIVTRDDANTVRIAEFEQWAEPLRDNILRVLASDLAVLLPRHSVRSYPSAVTGAKIDYRILIDLDRFDVYPGQCVKLSAHWTVINDKTRLPVLDKISHIEKALTDTSYSAAAGVLSATLHELGQQLAADMQALK